MQEMNPFIVDFLLNMPIFFEGDVVGNSTYTSMGYNVIETIAGDSVLSVLMVSSFSLSEYIQGSFSCVGRVGNPLEERAASADTPPITSRCKQAHLSVFPCMSLPHHLKQRSFIHSVKYPCSINWKPAEFACSILEAI